MNYVLLPLIATAYRWQKDRLERFFAVWGGRNRFVVGLFLLKLLQLFQHRFLLRGLAARCGKLLLIQHHVNILADIFQGRDVRLQGFQLGAQLCAARLQRRKFGIQCRKIHRCTAVQLHQGADSFIEGVQFLFVLGGVSVLGQLEVLLDKGVMDGL